MNLSVIIACFNAEKTLAVQLEALANQEWSEPWEVIISDNGSTDESVKIAQQYKERLPNLRIVDSSDRQGASYARNVGVLNATGEAVAFCDADDEVAPGWVAAMGKALSEYDFVTGRVELQKLNRPEVIDPTWVQLEGIGMTFPRYLPFALGCNIGIKCLLHHTVAGFDESFPFADDVDYSWRVQLAGAKLHYVPDALVHYRLRDSLWGLFCRACDYGEDDVLLYKRYLPLGMPKHKWTTTVRDGWRLLKRLPQVSSVKTRAMWVGHFGRFIGQWRGSIKHRLLY